LEPSGNSASNIDSGESGEVREPLPLPPVSGGFAEQAALFRNVVELPVELRALRGRLDPQFLRWAAARATALGISADAVVRRSGVLPPDALLEAYAADLGLKIDPLDEIADFPIDVPEVLSTGILKWNGGQTIALSGDNIKSIYERLSSDTNLVKEIRITSPERLRAFLERSQEKPLAQSAAFGLLKKQPEFSAASTRFVHYRTLLLAALAAAALTISFIPGPALFAIELLLATVFLAWAALRLFACATRREAANNNEIDERELPVYTILVPLHREARIVPELVNAISALNYPREKLDVKLILEPDDDATIAAVKAIYLDPCFEIVMAPLLGPRTKPKALRAALPFARGGFVVVYDAEDRPHPDQLRDAYARFLRGGDNLSCVQAKLAIDNTYPSFLTAHFRAEYSGLFDVLLPALVRLRLPVPLGGTSNHFKTRALREAGGWDAHNVTEDADLGVRFARLGFTIDAVDSTTWEEAPAQLSAWLPQRTRWMKGWLQTYVVHMRDPLLLLRQLGWRGFLAFQLLIGGTVLAALVHPVFVLWMIADSAFGSLFLPAETLAQWAQKALVFVTLASGYIASGFLAFVGMRRRGLLSSSWVLLTIPLYWLLLSAAAWRAVWKLITAPYQWEKTTHGVVKRKRENN
jgi:cellulose synthase/poly-beta-1,6-N-acetylglucosamine synthase-like glycosyltransferase